MAAAMVCAPPGKAVGESEIVALAGHHADAHHAVSNAALGLQGQGHHDLSAQDASHDGPSQAVQDKCNFCSASCSATPVPSSEPLMPSPVAASAAAFPHLSAAAVSFLSDGQERPPRTI
jgi:hypothetical protein